jgi:ribosome biogenesis GTPase
MPPLAAQVAEKRAPLYAAPVARASPARRNVSTAAVEAHNRASIARKTRRLTTLASLGFDDFFASQLERLGNPQWVPARIVAEGQSSFHLAGCRAPLGDLSGTLRGSLTKVERPVVGDWVAVVDGADRASIQRVLERRTTLLRRAAGTLAEPQVVAVNVDVFFVVTAVNREFNERRLERYVAAVLNSGAEPVIVLNKVDLADDLAPLLEAIDRAAIGVPVVRASAASGEGVDALRAYIGMGKTVGFIGSSGVGKSSLMNRLLGREAQAVGGLRGDERGRHTTTARQLIELAGGGVLIDTPGLRELGLLDDAGGVDTSFVDVTAFAERCRFRDCAHESEPGCAVLAAVASKELPAERLASYRKLQKEIAAVERKNDPVLAGRTKARWKEVHRALRARAKIDPKLKR